MVPCPSSLEGLQPVDGFAELWLHGPSTTPGNLVTQWHLQSGDSKLTHHLPLCFLKPLLMVPPFVTHLLIQYLKPQGLLWLSYHLPSPMNSRKQL